MLQPRRNQHRSQSSALSSMSLLQALSPPSLSRLGLLPHSPTPSSTCSNGRLQVSNPPTRRGPSVILDPWLLPGSLAPWLPGSLAPSLPASCPSSALPHYRLSLLLSHNSLYPIHSYKSLPHISRPVSRLLSCLLSRFRLSSCLSSCL
jgi:hypothetical protein